MKPARNLCLSLSFLSFLAGAVLVNAASNDAITAPLEDCIALPNFSVGFFRSKTMQEVKLSKNFCTWKLVVFQGKGEKIEINACKPEVILNVYPSIEASTPEILRPGSYACPQTALFGADFSQQAGDLERFDQQRSHIFDLLADGLNTYKESVLGSSGAQLRCSRRVLKAYLENCKSFAFPENSK